MRRGRATGAALVLAAALLGGAGAWAQTIPVRAGEHGSFTRLVLRVPDAEGWRLDSAPDGFELRGPAGASFDTDGVFARIPRDRLQALVPRGGGRLGLLVGCDCHGSAFVAPGVGFVVDILEGPAPLGAVAPGARVAGPALPPLRPLPLDGLTLDLPPAGQAPFLLALRVPEEPDRVARTETAMLDSVAAAADQGLLDLAATAGREATDGVQPAASDLESRPGVTFRSGAEGPAGRPEPLGNNGEACLSDEVLDLSTWGGTGNVAAEIAARLSALMDERDRMVPEAGLALARTYLAFGFGREAGVALGLDGSRSAERDLLGLLARLMDGDPVPRGTLEDQAGCLGPVALWRALARGSVRGTDERERIAISVALRDLPEPARAAVSLRLAGLFLEAGDPAGAEALAALHEGAGTEAALARAGIALESEEPRSALEELVALARSDARITPDAMTDLLDLSVREGRMVDQDLLELSQALRFEHGAEDTRSLLLAEGRALVAQDRFEEALVLLDSERRIRPGEDLDSGLTDAVAALTERLGDAQFLELVLSGLPPDLPALAREVASRRLLALGFPDEAWALRGLGASATPEPGPSVEGAIAVPGPSLEAPPVTSDSRTAEPPIAEPSPVEPEVEVAAVTLPLEDPSRAAPVGLDRPLDSSDPGATEPLDLPPAAQPVTPPAAQAASLDVPVSGPLPDIVPLVATPGSEPPPTAEAAPAEAPPATPAQPPAAAPAVPPAGGMSLAERRALLVEAEEARTRAAALLEGSAAGD